MATTEEIERANRLAAARGEAYSERVLNDDALATLRTQRDQAHARQDWTAVSEADYQIRNREAWGRIIGEQIAEQKAVRAPVKTLKRIDGERAAITDPLQRAQHDERTRGVRAVAEARTVTTEAPAATDPLVAHRAAVRATHARLASVNPIAAAAFAERHPEIHEPEPDAA